MKKWLFLFLTVLSAKSQALEKVFLFGGGIKPPKALERFVQDAGGSQAQILVVTWASEIPDEVFQSFTKELSQFTTKSVTQAPLLSAATRLQVLDLIRNSNAIFFTGGDQNKIMDALTDREVFDLLRSRYSAGVVFAGTSAGTAIMSKLMLTGDADLSVIDASRVGTREGLGLLDNWIVDQHFIKRQRENRLFALALQNKALRAIGVDEGMAALMVNGKLSETFGPTQVMLIDADSTHDGVLRIELVRETKSVSK